MSNEANRREADRYGIRRKVTSTEACADDPSAHIVTLECGHWVRFPSIPPPKRLRCPICRDEPWPLMPMAPEEGARTIWVTKWALIDGSIRRFDNATIGAIRSSGHDNPRCAVVRVGATVHRFFRNEWHGSHDDAVRHIEGVRAKTLDSLAKHADKIASLEWVIR